MLRPPEPDSLAANTTMCLPPSTPDIDFVALGHQLIIEPNWVEKVISGDEEAIRYQLHAADLDDLEIKPPFLEFIRDMPGFDILGLNDDAKRQIDNVTYL